MPQAPPLPMPDFASIHVTGSSWHDLCEQVLAHTGEASDARLAFIYLADDLATDADRIIDYLRNHSGIPHWVGSVGMGLCSNGLETYAETAMSVLITPFDEQDFRIIPLLDDDLSDWLEATREWRTSTLASDRRAARSATVRASGQPSGDAVAKTG